MTKTLPMIKSDEIEYTCAEDEFQSFIVATDGVGEGDYHIDLRQFRFTHSLYVDSERNSHGCCNLFEDDAERTPEFEAFLKTLQNDYKIVFSIGQEDCISGRWFSHEDAYFGSAKDRDAFVDFLNLRAEPTVKTTSAIVKQTSYTAAEANLAHAEITGLVSLGKITKRTGAAYKAHVSRRVEVGS